jgi:hypothetical protein
MNNRYVICYPGGAGGSFLAAALTHVLTGTTFVIDSESGHCHNNNNHLNNIWFNHGESTNSARQELDVIDQLSILNIPIFEGHFRNIVALKEKMIDQLGYNIVQDTKFIKISVDHNSSNEILFVAKMLQRKSKCPSTISFDEYLTQTTNYIHSWYWVENAYTLPNTINLSLADIFLNKVSAKINLPEPLSIKLDQCQHEYQQVQQQLHQDLLGLINEQHQHSSNYQQP